MTCRNQLSTSDNKLQLQKEYELLLQGEHFRRKFVDLAKDCGVKLPSKWFCLS
jgi:hypothetical protein